GGHHDAQRLARRLSELSAAHLRRDLDRVHAVHAGWHRERAPPAPASRVTDPRVGFSDPRVGFSDPRVRSSDPSTRRRPMITRAMLLLLLAVTLSAPPVAAQQGVGETEIVLGGSNSFSGPLAFTGEQITKFGVDLYLRVVNDAGGIHGRKIRTIYYDDGYRPQDSVANTKKLVEQDGVFAIIIPQGSPPVVATLEYLEEHKVPMLFPYQSSPVTRARR